MVMLLLMLVLLWSVFGSLARKEFDSGSSEAQLFLACLVGPFGVWTRWYLARLNGRGLGRKGVLKWMPFGTLAANVVAACVMAALATLKKAVSIHLKTFHSKYACVFKNVPMFNGNSLYRLQVRSAILWQQGSSWGCSDA